MPATPEASAGRRSVFAPQLHVRSNDGDFVVLAFHSSRPRNQLVKLQKEYVACVDIAEDRKLLWKNGNFCGFEDSRFKGGGTVATIRGQLPRHPSFVRRGGEYFVRLCPGGGCS